MKKKSTYDITKKAASLIANEGVKNYQNGSDVSIEGMRLFYHAAKNTENVDFAQRKGNLFEYIEASKFNYKAAIARVETRAVVTAADGRPHDPSDIDLVRNEKIIRRVQAKFMNTRDVQGRDTSAASSVLAQAGGQGKNGGHWGKYDGMQRLIRKGDSYQTDPVTGKPVSILDESVKLARRRGNVEGGLHAKEYADVADNLTDQLTDETTGVTSGGTTLEEMDTAAASPEKYVCRTKMKCFSNEVGASAKAGAEYGALMSGIVSSIVNTCEVLQDKKELKKAVKDIGKSVAGGSIRGGATGSLSAVLRISGVQRGIPVISDSTAATILAGGIIDTGVMIYAYGKDEITTEELQESMTDTVIKSAATIYMTKAVGLALGSCGAFVPMAVYSVASYMVICTREIIQNAELTTQEYRRLAVLLDDETAVIYEQKALMECQMAWYIENQQSNMRELLENVDAVMHESENYDLAITSMITFANETGMALQHAEIRDFDVAMHSDAEFILK